MQSMVTNKLVTDLRKGSCHAYRLTFNLQRVQFRNLPMKPIEDIIPGFRSDEPDPAASLLAHFMYQNGFVHPLQECDEGWTPFCYAALAGDPLLLSALLEAKADPNDTIKKPDDTCQFAAGMSAFQICAFFKHNEALRLLLASRADPKWADGYRATPLHWAAVNDNIEGIQILKMAGGSVEACNMLGYSPFVMACLAGNVTAIKELLPVPDEELTLGLHTALMCGGGSADVVSTLIEADADVNQQRHEPLWSPVGMMFAVLGLRHLWKPSRLSMYAYHQSQATPLMCSILSSSFDAAAVLIEAGARRDLVNSRGKTAQDLAREISAPDYIMAAFNGDLTVIESLVRECSRKLVFEL